MAGGVSRLLVVVWVFVVGFRFELDFGLVLGCWFSELWGLVVSFCWLFGDYVSWV